MRCARSPHFERIEVGAACRYRSLLLHQPDAVDPSRVVVHAGQIGVLRPIDPERQAAIASPAVARTQFNQVWGITDGKPAAACPAVAVVAKGRMLIW